MEYLLKARKRLFDSGGWGVFCRLKSETPDLSRTRARVPVRSAGVGSCGQCFVEGCFEFRYILFPKDAEPVDPNRPPAHAKRQAKDSPWFFVGAILLNVVGYAGLLAALAYITYLMSL